MENPSFLKKCPLCGHSAFLYSDFDDSTCFTVSCLNGNECGAGVGGFYRVDDAVDTWNKRELESKMLVELTNQFESWRNDANKAFKFALDQADKERARLNGVIKALGEDKQQLQESIRYRDERYKQ